MEGLPDTGSNPAQMDIGVSYNNRVLRENSMECVSGVSRLEGVDGMEERARYVGCACRIPIIRCVGSNCKIRLSQGMWEMLPK
jgi:hypothetical protein